MAGTSPRRSSRARTTQSQSHHSSNSSQASGRPERSTRSFNKNGSPPKSTPTASLSSEPPEDSVAPTEESISTRRRTRGQDETKPKTDADDMANGADEIQEEDEAVRCICGYEDYPGPPPFDEVVKNGTKDAIDMEPLYSNDPEQIERLAGFFVQCDVCKVWQHGACVGFIPNDDDSDESYFCEECRKDLHRVFTSTTGQRYSHYLPVSRNSRTTSRATSLVKDSTKTQETKSKKTAEQTAASHASRRRLTMNSRGVYDEDEELRRAIEASKQEAQPELAEPATRRAKRGRSDSEEKPEGPKRQRTNSRSASPVQEKPKAENTAVTEESDDATNNQRPGSSKKSRSSISRNQREKTEREERDRQRAEAANKRKGRAERRRADESDPSEELPLAARAVVNRTTAESAPPAAPEPPAAPQPAPDTPPANQAPLSSSNKKSSRPTTKKKGRNQYTKDREAREDDSPARSQSRDIQQKNTEENGVATHPKPAGGDHGKHSSSKPRGGMNSKVTMHDMRRRAASILDFISRKQVDLAEERESMLVLHNNSSSNADTPKTNGNTPAVKDSPQAQIDAETAAHGAQANGVSTPKKNFRELNSTEMMDFLARDLVKWQNEYGPN